MKIYNIISVHIVAQDIVVARKTQHSLGLSFIVDKPIELMTNNPITDWTDDR